MVTVWEIAYANRFGMKTKHRYVLGDQMTEELLRREFEGDPNVKNLKIKKLE